MDIEEIRGLTAFRLADVAECLCPDSPDSPGALFLTSVRDAWIEAIEDGPVHDDQIHEIADNAPDVYTYQRWCEFVDLGAWQEEAEACEWPKDLTDAAGVALYQIAERLCWALLDKYQLAT